MGILTALSLSLVAGVQAPLQKDPYTHDLQNFVNEDRKNPPVAHPILFIGSSSFTRWTDVKDYFPDYPILNRAFGGSTLLDEIRHVKDVVYPYSPKQVVIYCGENDFAADPKLAAYKVTDRFKELFHLIRNRYPQVPVVYVAMKPSPSRWFMRSKFIAANRWIEEFLKHQNQTTFVNVWDPMLDSTGRPKPDIFVGDKLHMNASGYHIWQPLIQPTLIK